MGKPYKEGCVAFCTEWLAYGIRNDRLKFFLRRFVSDVEISDYWCNVIMLIIKRRARSERVFRGFLTRVFIPWNASLNCGHRGAVLSHGARNGIARWGGSWSFLISSWMRAVSGGSEAVNDNQVFSGRLRWGKRQRSLQSTHFVIDT